MFTQIKITKQNTLITFLAGKYVSFVERQN